MLRSLGLSLLLFLFLLLFVLYGFMISVGVAGMAALAALPVIPLSILIEVSGICNA